MVVRSYIENNKKLAAKKAAAEVKKSLTTDVTVKKQTSAESAYDGALPSIIGNNSEKNSDIANRSEKDFVSISNGDNLAAERLSKTGIGYERNADIYSARLEENAMKRAKQEKAIIVERDKNKRERAGLLEDKLESIESKANSDAELRRADASDIVKQQDLIASRQANQAVARSGEAGLVLSSGVIQSILDDTAAKYGENIKSAKEFELKTNMSLDGALKDLGLTVFQNQSAINVMIANLDSEEAIPMINAIAKAAEGDKKALDDVYSFYQGILRKLKDGQFQRADIRDRQNEQEKQWGLSNPVQRLNDITGALGKTPGFNEIASLVPGILEQYKNLSRAALITKIKELAQKALNNTQLRTILAQTDAFKDPEVKAFILDTFEEGTDVNINNITTSEFGLGDQRLRDDKNSEAFSTLNKNPESYFASYDGDDLSEFLDANQVDSSFTNKRVLAKQYGVDFVYGTAEEETNLLEAIKKARIVGKEERENKTLIPSYTYRYKGKTVSKQSLDKGFSDLKKLVSDLKASKADYSPKDYKKKMANYLLAAKNLIKIRKGRVSNTNTGSSSNITPGLSVSGYKGTSIVDYLNQQGLPSKPSDRKKLAAKYGIVPYTYLGPQNIALLKAMIADEGSKSSSGSNYKPTSRKKVTSKITPKRKTSSTTTSRNKITSKITSRSKTSSKPTYSYKGKTVSASAYKKAFNKLKKLVSKLLAEKSTYSKQAYKKKRAEYVRAGRVLIAMKD